MREESTEISRSKLNVNRSMKAIMYVGMFFVLAFLFFSPNSKISKVKQAFAKACTSAQTGDWATSTTWTSANSCNVSGGPIAGDTITIAAGHSITVSTVVAAASISISANSVTTTSINMTGGSLTLSGTLTMNAPSANSTTTVAVGARTLSVGTLTIIGGNQTKISQVTISTGVLTVTGNITNCAGTAGNMKITFTGAGTMNVGGTFGTGCTFTASTSTVVFNGSGAQTMNAYSYNNVTVNNSASAGTMVTVAASLTIGGNLLISDGELDTSTVAFAVTGTTTIDSGGELQISSTTGSKAFTGNIIVNSGGSFSFSAAEALSIAGSLQVDGTWSGTTGAISMTGSSKSITGTAAFTMASLVATSVTNTNTGGLTVSGAISGTLFTNGANGILSVDTAPSVTTFTANASGNRVTYTCSCTMKAESTAHYYDLTIDSSGTVTVPASTMTVDHDLAISAGTFSTSTQIFTVTGTTSITGALTYASGANAKTFTGAVTVNSGGSVDFNSLATDPVLNFAGGITASSGAGSINWGTGNTAFTATQAFAGSANMTFPSTVTISTGANILTNNNTGIITFSGTLTGGNGSSEYDTGLNSTTKFSAAPMATGILKPSTSANTIDYTYSGPTCKAPTTNNYYHLTFSGGGTITCTVTTLGGNLSVTAGSTWTTSLTTISGNLSITGAATITLGANLVVTGTTTLGNSSNASVLNQGATFDFTTGAVTVTTSASWTNTGTGDVTLSGDVANAGTITLNSNAGTGCIDGTNSILIRSTVNNTTRAWSGAGTFTLRNLDVDDMTGTISVSVSTLSGDTTWTDICYISIAGTIYQNDGTTVYNCNSNALTVAVRLNSVTYTGTCSAVGGTYTVSSIAIPALNDVIVVFLDEETENATTITKAGGTSSISNYNLYQNRITIRTETNASAMTILNMDTYDAGNDSDIQYTATDAGTDTLVVADASMILVFDNGDTATAFTPGGSVTTSVSNDGTDSNVDGDLTVQSGATMTMGTFDLSVGGDISNSGTLSVSTNQLTILTATQTGHTITDGGTNFYNVRFNGASGGWSFADSTTIAGTLSILNGTLSGSSDITVNGEVGGSGTITLTGGTFEQRVAASSTFGSDSGSNPWTFSTLTFSSTNATYASVVTVNAGTGSITVTTKLNVGKSGDTKGTYLTESSGRSWVLSGPTTPLDVVASPVSFIYFHTSSTVQYSGTGTVNVAAVQYPNLTLGGTGTYALPSSDVTITGNLVVTSGGSVTKSASNKLIFAGGTSQTVTDNNVTKQDLGIVQISAGGISYSAPSSAVLDNFDRADATTLGTNWSLNQEFFNPSGGDGGIISNQAYSPTTDTTFASFYYNVAQYGTSSEVFLTYNVLSTLQATNINLRVQNPGLNTWSGYTLTIASDHHDSIIQRTDAPDTSTALGEHFDMALSGGNTIALRAIGSQLQAWVKKNGIWYLMAERTDATYVRSGYMGYYSSDNNAGTDPWRVDDFSGGTLTATNTTLTLGSSIKVTSLTIDASQTFNQGASYDITTSGASTVITVNTGAAWTNIGTGDVTLSGDVSNAGTITLNTNNGTQCVDIANDIVIRSTVNNTTHAWSGAGTFVLYNLDVDDMTGTLTAYTSTLSGDTTWSSGSCGGGFTVSGTAYATNETSALGSGKTIAIRVNGTLAGTGDGGTGLDDTDGSGNWTFASVTATAGATITIYINGETEKGNVITISDGSSAITGISIYDDHVVIRADNSSTAITILDLIDYDNDENSTDMLFDAEDSSPDTLVIEDGNELHINTTDTFTPGGTITTDPSASFSSVDGDLHIDGTGVLSMGTNALSVGGDFNNEGTLTVSSGQTTTFTATTSGHTIEDGSSNFDAITFNGSSSGVWTTQSASAPTGHVTVTAGTLTLGAQLTIAATKQLSVGASGTISLGSNTLDLLSGGTGSSRPFLNSGTFSGGTGNVIYEAASGTAIETTGVSYYDLNINPTLSSAVTYTPIGALTVTHNFGMAPTGNYELTLTLAGNSSVTGSVTTAGSSSPINTINMVTYNLSAGTVTLGSSDTLNVGTGTLTVTGDTNPITVNGGLNINTGTIAYTGTTVNVLQMDYYSLSLGGSGTYTLPASTFSIFKNLTIASGATIVTGGTVVFNGATTQTWTDNNATAQNIGNVQVSKGTDLTTTLTSFWGLEEASSTRADSIGGNTLTDNNTVLSATGKVGTAADFESSTSESLSHIDNTSLSTGDIDFTWAAWIKPESVGSNMAIISKDNGSVYEYEMYVDTSSLLHFYVENGGSSSNVTANTFGPISAGSWYYVVGWHDSVTNTNNIQVNDSFVKSTAYTGGVLDNAHTFRLGSTNSSLYFDGLIDQVGFWKRVLTPSERTALYNSGSGLAYASLSTPNTNSTLILGSSVKATSVTVDSSQTLQGGSGTLTLTANSSPLTVNGTFGANSGTVEFVPAQASGTITIPNLDYYNLKLNKSSNTFRPSAGTINVTNNLDITAGTLDLDTTDPTMNIGTGPTTTWCNGASAVCNNNWLSRKKITLDNSASSENLVNFPVLVQLSSSNIDYTKVKDGGADLRFYDSNGTTLLDHEVESWNESGTSYVWVRVPQIDSASSSDYIWMYYNNAAAGLSENPSGVWNSSYKAVWHMGQNPANGVLDSTSNRYHLTQSGSMTSGDVVTGKAGSAINFDGTDDYLYYNTELGLTASNVTLSMWANADAAESGAFMNVGTSNEVANDGYSIGLGNGSNMETESSIITSGFGNVRWIDSATALGTGWHQVVLRLSATGKPEIYKDGASVYSDSGTNATLAGTGKIYVGGYHTIDFQRYGLYDLDEVRISNTPRTAEWIEAEYLYSTDSTKYTYAPEENISVSGGTLTITGALSASATSTLTVGKIVNNGTFTHNNGTVVMSTTGPTSSIIGSAGTTDFYNLSMTSAGKEFQIEASDTIGVAGTLTLTGTQNDPIILSSTTSTQWLMHLTGTATVRFVRISNSGCTSSNDIGPHETVIDMGNNGTCWLFISRGRGGNGASGGGSGSSGAVGGGGNSGGGGGSGGTAGGTSTLPETFTSSNSTDLTTYSLFWTLNRGNFKINTNAVYPNSAGDYSSAYWNATSISNNQFAEITFNAVSTPFLGVGVRLQSGAAINGYILYAEGSNIFLDKMETNNPTRLITGSSGVTTGDVLRLEANGTTLTAKKNGVTIGTVTDSTYSSGSPGLAGFGDGTTTRGDSFNAGAVSGGGGGGSVSP